MSIGQRITKLVGRFEDIKNEMIKVETELNQLVNDHNWNKEHPDEKSKVKCEICHTDCKEIKECLSESSLSKLLKEAREYIKSTEMQGYFIKEKEDLYWNSKQIDTTISKYESFATEALRDHRIVNDYNLARANELEKLLPDIIFLESKLEKAEQDIKELIKISSKILTDACN
jgi:hypothetical protein